MVSMPKKYCLGKDEYQCLSIQKSNKLIVIVKPDIVEYNAGNQPVYDFILVGTKTMKQ